MICRAAVLASLALLIAMPAQASDAANQVLVDGFDSGGFAPEGGLYYRNNFEQDAGKVEFQNDVRLSGSGALKLSVVPHCPADMKDCSERAEIWERTNLRVPYETGVWYGFAVRFADPIPADDHRYLIAQWKREIDNGADGDFSPFLAFRLNHGKLFISVETNYHPSPTARKQTALGTCPDGQSAVWLRPDTNQMRVFVAGDPTWTPESGDEYADCSDKVSVIARGGVLPPPTTTWTDFAIYSRPGPDGDGRIELFVNKQWLATVTGFIGHGDKGLGENQYFKFGPYRAADTRDWALYYDDFRRSPKCIDVLRDAAGCKAAGLP